MSRLVPRVAQRDGPSIQQRVALTDGAEALQQQVGTPWPESTLILDVIHATEYLWDTANAWLGETHPQRLAWVRAFLEPLLAGQSDAVITALEAEAKDPTGTVTQQQAVRRTVGYSRRNQPDMHDDASLARGWRWGRAWWKVPVDTSSKIAWNRQGGAGPPAARRRCSTCGRYGSMAIGKRIGSFISNKTISGCMVRSAPAPTLAEARAVEWAA
jgi:hypothetical protein